MVLYKREAETSCLSKLGFLANPSHELRTPLNQINGFCKITQEELEEESLGHPNTDLSKVYLAGDPLMKWVEQIIDISKMVGKPEWIDL